MVVVDVAAAVSTNADAPMVVAVVDVVAVAGAIIFCLCPLGGLVLLRVIPVMNYN